MDKNRREKLIQTIALLKVPGIGPQRFKNLIDAFGSIAHILKAPLSELEQTRELSRPLASELQNSYNETKAEEIALQIEKLRWDFLFSDEDEYPHLLKKIHSSPPLIFCTGQPLDNNDRMIAIVGTRRATDSGRHIAYQLANSLASDGIVVVSGMAEGIDSSAHAGALEAGGKTIAVWGSSLDHVFPTSNKSLAERIKESGTIISEYLPGTRPDKTTFPSRNRIISGMSEGIIVVEAGQKSGALITASLALEQGREVFAVPGSPMSKASIGTNQLIKEGASLVTSVEDIYSSLPTLKGTVISKRFVKPPDMTDVEEQLLELISSEPIQLDQLSRTANLSIGELSQLLLALELKGIVREISGKRFMLSEEFTSC